MATANNTNIPQGVPVANPVYLVDNTGTPISSTNGLAGNALTASTATLTNVASAASDTALLASNSNRKGAYFYNESTAVLYLSYGSTPASTTAYTTQIPAQCLFEMPTAPLFTGAVRGIWASVNGTVRITELS